MAEIFFTSYARLDNSDGKLTAAVDRLVARVTAKVGEAVTVFFDTSELKNGIEWEEKLGKALQELRVIVCLCSPAYLKSAFCAKEFEVFRRRIDEHPAGPNMVAIIPVIWEPVASLPEVINRFHQPKDPRFPSDYYAAGLWKLATLKSQEDNFVRAIDELAKDIQSADADSKLPPWSHPVRYDSLPNFLNNPRPDRYGVSVTVLNEKNSQWKPGNVRSSIGSLVEAVAGTLRVGWQEVPARLAHLPDLLQQLADAEQRRLASVIVVDRDDASKAPYDEMLRLIAGAGHKNVHVLVGGRDTPQITPTDVKEGLAKLVPGMPFDSFKLDDETAFKNALTTVITKLRVSMLEGDEAVKVVAPDLREAAMSTGIPVDNLTTLKGPGAPS